jgi:DNA-binding MarR family transcriptional regulator
VSDTVAFFDVLRLSDPKTFTTGSVRSPGQRACAAAATTARALCNQRRLRDRCFGAELFRDPAWDILLDLYVAAELGRKISVSSACGASGVPAATALRWLTKLEKVGTIVRIPDGSDGRTVHVELTPVALDKMTGLLGRIALHASLSGRPRQT